MNSDTFKPIAVKPPSGNRALFRLRCAVDVQLGSIVRALRPAMMALDGDVLDVGAGESPWREWLPSGCSYHGLDVANADDYGMRRRPEVTYYDGRTMPFPAAHFDGAICIEVLEHVEDPEAFMAELARTLKPRATLLLTVPWSARRHHIPHDYHRFTKERLGILIRQAGFEGLDIRERGNDVAVIANKLIVVCARLLRPRRRAALAWTLPLAVLTLPLAAAWLAASHVSTALGLGAPEDPLGYFVRARRTGATS